MYVRHVRAEQEAIMFGNVVIYAKTAEGASVGCTRSAEHDRGA
jgi:hypothetical protein